MLITWYLHRITNTCIYSKDSIYRACRGKRDMHGISRRQHIVSGKVMMHDISRFTVNGIFTVYLSHHVMTDTRTPQLSLVSVILLRKHSTRMKTVLNSNTINNTKSNSYKAINTLKYLLFTYTLCYSGESFTYKI